MRTRLITAALTLAVIAISAPADATPIAGPADKSVKPGTQLLLTFDHKESLKSGTIVRDASGHHHAGRIQLQKGGRIAPGQGWFKRGADYRPHHGRAIIEVRDGQGLDPRRKSFVFGAAVRTTAAKAVNGMNVVQKGYFHQTGGQYKLQLQAGGVPSCVVAGALGRAIITAQNSIANGTWHRLSCTRTATAVTLRVDGVVRATDEIATGWLGNDSAIRIGGKKINPGNKQYRGHLDSVFLRKLAA